MNDLTKKHLTIFGAGSFGSELIRRLLLAGVPKEQVTVCDPDRGLAQEVARHFEIRLICTADQAICEADALLLALPATASLEMLQKVSACLFQKVLVINFSALPVSKIEALLRANTPVIRIKSGTQGTKVKKPITYGKGVKPEDRLLAKEILAAIGEVGSFPADRRETMGNNSLP